jgi:TolB-like protein
MFVVVFGSLLFAGSIHAGERPSFQEEKYAYYDNHVLPGDYVYRTEKVLVPQTETKTFWDYLSFFALPEKKTIMLAVPAEEATELKMRVRELSHQLIKNSEESIAEEYVVTVSSFVNLNNLYQISSLGRYIGEQLLGELQLAGVEVIDVRKTPGLMIHERQGEYGLSREMTELSYIHGAHANVVGTYTYSDGQILINTRLLRNPDGMVLSQANLVFELDPMTRGLLADDGMPSKNGSKVRVQAFQENN